MVAEGAVLGAVICLSTRLLGCGRPVQAMLLLSYVTRMSFSFF